MNVVYQLYKATDPNGRGYIGCTAYWPEKRWATHSAAPRPWPGDARAQICDAISRFGREAFAVEHLATAFGISDAGEIETLLIEQHGTRHPRGYNRYRGGGGLVASLPGRAASRRLSPGVSHE